MPHIPLLQKTLGEDWHRLPAVIQRHYAVGPGLGSSVQGVMEIGYPSGLLPLIKLIHLCGGLIARRGETVETRVQKTVPLQTAELCWQRTLTYPDNQKDSFQSRMVYLQDHELIEYVRFGFGLRLKLSVDNGNLIYRSNGHIWQCGGFRLTFPDWLLLGAATIVERPESGRQFSLDFSIRHPLFGLTYYYRGVFRYCE
jgi:hypothetical protein